MASQTNPATICDAFLEALGARDFARLETLLHPDARLRELIPGPANRGEFRSVRDARGVVSTFRRWFGDAERLELIASDAFEVGFRLHVAYRFRVHHDVGWEDVEQRLSLDIRDGRVSGIDLMSSGSVPA